MVDGIIKIPKKDNPRGEDGYKTFSIRIREETVAALDALAKESGRSRNELINMMLEYGVAHSEVDE